MKGHPQMKMNEPTLPDLQALVAFGKLGIAILSARMLSVLALLATVALSGFVAYSPSWQGAACVLVLALVCFYPSLRVESARQERENGEQS
jgi:hypothetical protein